MSLTWRDAVVAPFITSFLSANCFAESADVQSDDSQTYRLVVTAQKVEQDAQDVPVSLSIFTQEDLEKRNINRTYDLISQTPNLNMIKAGNPSDASFMSLRGITPTMEGSQTVLFLIDGVPYSTFDSDILDAERVEILRGPQGTLYGKNASSGVINVITQDPKYYREGSISLGLGNYGRKKSTIISNDAINDEWAYRTALQYELNDGYFERNSDGADDIDNVENFNGRFKLRWQPYDTNWDVISTFQAMRTRNGNNSFAAVSDIEMDSHAVYSDVDGYNNVDVYSGVINATYTGNSFDFKSVTGFISDRKKSEQDLDFTSTSAWILDMDTEQNRFTQELRLSSKKNQDLNWLGGLYFESDSVDNLIHTEYQNYGITNDINSDTKSLNYALFGNLSYAINQKWEFITGLRVEHQRIEFGYTNAYNYGSATSENYNASYTKLLPKIGLNYSPTDEIMFYLSISEGYKSGGFNMLTPSGLSPKYDPEYTMNYELGMKSSWLDRTLMLDASLFWIDWKDQQVEQQAYPNSYTENAANTVSRGIEAQLDWAVSEDFRIYLSGGFNDAKFTDYVGKTYDSSGNVVSQTDYSGNRPTNAPRYTYSLGADYQFFSHYFVNIGYNVIGDMYFDVDNTTKQSSFSLLNLNTGYTSERYDVSLWVKNLLDEEYITRSFSMTDLNGSTVWYGRSGDPMTMGIDFKVKW